MIVWRKRIITSEIFLSIILINFIIKRFEHEFCGLEKGIIILIYEIQADSVNGLKIKLVFTRLPSRRVVVFGHGVQFIAVI